MRSMKACPFLLPTPILLVGTYDRFGRPNIMPASWGGICASQPPSLAVSIRKTRWTHAAIQERNAFTVSIPNAEMIAQVDFAGLHSGEKLDKFSALGWTAVTAEHVDAPYVGECPLVLELVLSQTIEIGSHTQYIGEIMDTKIDEGCLMYTGIPDVQSLNPCFYAPLAQEYWSLGSFIARAHSVGHTVTHSVFID